MITQTGNSVTSSQMHPKGLEYLDPNDVDYPSFLMSKASNINYMAVSLLESKKGQSNKVAIENKKYLSNMKLMSFNQRNLTDIEQYKHIVKDNFGMNLVPLTNSKIISTSKFLKINQVPVGKAQLLERFRKRNLEKLEQTMKNELQQIQNYSYDVHQDSKMLSGSNSQTNPQSEKHERQPTAQKLYISIQTNKPSSFKPNSNHSQMIKKQNYLNTQQSQSPQKNIDLSQIGNNSQMLLDQSVVLTEEIGQNSVEVKRNFNHNNEIQQVLTSSQQLKNQELQDLKQIVQNQQREQMRQVRSVTENDAPSRAQITTIIQPYSPENQYLTPLIVSHSKNDNIKKNMWPGAAARTIDDDKSKSTIFRSGHSRMVLKKTEKKKQQFISPTQEMHKDFNTLQERMNNMKFQQKFNNNSLAHNQTHTDHVAPAWKVNQVSLNFNGQSVEKNAANSENFSKNKIRQKNSLRPKTTGVNERSADKGQNQQKEIPVQTDLSNLTFDFNLRTHSISVSPQKDQIRYFNLEDEFIQDPQHGNDRSGMDQFINYNNNKQIQNHQNPIHLIQKTLRQKIMQTGIQDFNLFRNKSINHSRNTSTPMNGKQNYKFQEQNQINQNNQGRPQLESQIVKDILFLQTPVNQFEDRTNSNLSTINFLVGNNSLSRNANQRQPEISLEIRAKSCIKRPETSDNYKGKRSLRVKTSASSVALRLKTEERGAGDYSRVNTINNQKLQTEPFEKHGYYKHSSISGIMTQHRSSESQKHQSMYQTYLSDLSQPHRIDENNMDSPNLQTLYQYYNDKYGDSISSPKLAIINNKKDSLSPDRQKRVRVSKYVFQDDNQSANVRHTILENAHLDTGKSSKTNVGLGPWMDDRIFQVRGSSNGISRIQDRAETSKEKLMN